MTLETSTLLPDILALISEAPDGRAAMTRAVLDESGYEEWLSNDPSVEAEARRGNVASTWKNSSSGNAVAGIAIPWGSNSLVTGSKIWVTRSRPICCK